MEGNSIDFTVITKKKKTQFPQGIKEKPNENEVIK